ncbi:sodium:proton antiporter [Candidatus Bathyarchaeota archaeon]|jgi:monovalent cation:H+ antiporter, CPA1 family|nr:sodium:proton antiporter [Candidatus Bathyarchaeota archaeon]MBT3284643.1 sodium:proton antiporter [Candidatus Bathyarchaeota archaeon]MBT4321021.1 sodium:proton antiporter [Candidatus Bathyarchaeota archaeon]MBT4425099.1 sodium:proton antiporter [Candidatus Bathyarchaeota archaeon]MBT5643297.1 sodium:proton antiporter [Candidatus Bathyarchaeota archaeon]
MEGGLGQFDSIYNILLMVVVITLIARQINLPSTIAFIFAGLLAASVPRIPLPDLSPEVFLSILLPPILFTETLTMDVDGLIDDSDTILSFAVAGTALMVTAIGLYTHLIFNLTWMEAFILGIIIAPTDPVSIITTFKRLGVIRRFQLIVAGESLFNDGFAVVIYSILLTIVNAGTISVGEILAISTIKIFGGAIIGYVAGYIVHLIFCWTEDLYVKTLLTFIVTFGVFRLAEAIRSSGVIAVVIAGLILNYRCRNHGGISEKGEETLNVMWEFVGFIASSFAFIFIGVSLDAELLSTYALPIIALSIMSTLFRFLMTEGISRVLERYRDKRIPWNWRVGMTWSGLRGAVSVVLVLGITGVNFANEQLLLALTYGIVLGTNLIQGLTMPWIINRFRLYSSSRAPRQPDEEQDDGILQNITG